MCAELCVDMLCYGDSMSVGCRHNITTNCLLICCVTVTASVSVGCRHNSTTNCGLICCVTVTACLLAVDTTAPLIVC
jgi:hypothetical protein